MRRRIRPLGKTVAAPPPLEWPPQPQFLIVLDDEFRQKCMALLEHASRPENNIIVGKTNPTRQRLRKHRLKWHDFGITYSVTIDKGRRLRHLSVDMLRGRLPPPLVVCTVAHWLGFTGATTDHQELVHGPAPTWGIHRFEGASHRIVVIEEIV